jgi:predicted Zn-dependent protease
MRLFAALALIALLAGCAGESPPASGATTSTPAQSQRSASPTSEAVVSDVPCAGTGRRVCLVPLADFNDPTVDSLVAHLRTNDIPATSAMPVELQLADVDRARSQLNAGKALDRVVTAYPEAIADRDVTLIALTDRDIFIEGQTYNWVFGMRRPPAYIISTARMYQETWGGERDDALRDSRLRKMLLRYVGLFHLRLPENDSPLTVLYRNLNGLRELDGMREGILQPSQLPQPSTTLGQWGAAFCGAAEQFAARNYRADVDLNREYSDAIPVAQAKTLVERYLLAQNEARREWVNALAPAANLAAAGTAEAKLNADLAEALRVSTRAIDAARSDVARASSTAAVTGRLVQLSVESVENSAAQALYDSYVSLPLDTLVAMIDAGPCGYFDPGAFFETPIV